MRVTLLGFVAMLSTAACTAGTLTDPFAQSMHCTLSMSPPYDGGCDVIGSNSRYDIQRADLTVTQDWVGVSLYFNFGSADLSSFSEAGLILSVGDVLFFDPSDPSTSNYQDLANHSSSFPRYRFGVPLVAHDGLNPGDLYRIAYDNGASGPLQTADSLLHNTSFYYRRNQPVWMPAGELLETAGTGVQVTPFGNGTTSGLYRANIGFVPTTAFQAIGLSGQVGVQWSVAICANDILTGTVPVTHTPEPGTLAMLAGAAALLGFGKLWRRSSRNAG